MITVENLHFTYPKTDKPAVSGMNFSIAQGEIFGFLGPSGAGKSTTQKIIIGLLRGYQGSVKVMGREVSTWGSEFYENIGVSFELPNHYLRLTALENLNYFASLYSGTTADPLQLLEMLGLGEAANMPVSQFSKGMKIRLNVARSLLPKPKILFLDEPTSGLDPVNARLVKDIVLEHRQRGATVFVTTHNMTLADELCDRVGFVLDGKIRLIDAPKALKKQYGRREVAVEYRNGTDQIHQREFALDTLGGNHEFMEIVQHHRIETLHTQETTLENIFIQVTGRTLA